MTLSKSIVSKSKPADQKLYDKVTKHANEIFKSNRGIYRSAWIVKEYKRLNGKYIGPKPTTKDPGLRRWFKERWVDLNQPIYSKDSAKHIIGYKPCGRADASKGEYPLCRPLRRVTNATPSTVSELSKQQIQKAKAAKRVVKATGNIKFKN